MAVFTHGVLLNVRKILEVDQHRVFVVNKHLQRVLGHRDVVDIILPVIAVTKTTNLVFGITMFVAPSYPVLHRRAS